MVDGLHPTETPRYLRPDGLEKESSASGAGHDSKASKHKKWVLLGVAILLLAGIIVGAAVGGTAAVKKNGSSEPVTVTTTVYVQTRNAGMLQRYKR